MISASKLELAKRCPGHVHLPQVDVRTDDSDAGIERHAVWEDEIGKGIIPEVLDERYPGYSWRAEVPFVFDAATGEGRELPKTGQHRDYGELGVFCVPGTADAVGIAPDRSKLVICDRKSYDRVPAAAVNLQLAVAALALSKAYAIDSVDVGIHYEVQPYDSATFDTFDLEVLSTEIKRVITSPSREVIEGPWCKHCGAQESCPLKKQLAIEVASGVADNRIDLKVSDVDDEQAADLYEFASRLRMMLRRLDAGLYARATARPIPLRSGRMFGRVETLGNRQLDGRKARELLAEMFDAEVADEAVTIEVTQSGIETALKNHLPKGGVAAAKKKVMERLEEMGGVTRKMRTVVEEFDATPQLKAGAQ